MISLHELLSARSLEKHNAWHTAQPRDEYGRWTSGFVTGAFSPVGAKPSKNQAAPFVGLAGTETGLGGALHGKSDWQSQPSWKGQPVNSKAQHEAAYKAYAANQKDLATPNDIEDHIQGHDADVAQANSLDGLADSAMKLPTAQTPDGQARLSTAQQASAAQSMAGLAQRIDAPGGSGFDSEAFDDANAPAELQGGYPEPKPGEAIIPPPGEPMPHEALASAVAETKQTWPDVDATPFAHAKTGGTNEGGFFEINGVKGYAKFYANPEQAQSEKLANDLYNALGISAPTSHLVSINGKKAIFNELVDAKHMTPEAVQAHPHMHAGFAADALLANHDVVGFSHDNIVDTGSGAMRLDNGGALKFRAQGAAKNGLSSSAVGELDSMRNPQYGAGKTFQHVSNDEVGQQVAMIDHVLTPEKIDALVMNAGFEGDQANEYRALLNGRVGGAVAWAKKNAPNAVIGASEKPEPGADATAAAQTEAKLTAETKPSTGNPLIDSIHPSLTAGVAADALSGAKPKDLDFPMGMGVAMADHDTAKFIGALSTPDLLKKAAKKAWFGENGEWAASQIAGVLSHLTGSNYHVVSTPTGGVRVQHAGGKYSKPIIAKPGANADAEQISTEAKASEKPAKSAYVSKIAQDALYDWGTKGTTADKPSHQALVDLAEHSYPVAKNAITAAGLLSHATGTLHIAKANEDGSYGVLNTHEAHNGMHTFLDHGLPEPSSYQFKTDSDHGPFDSMQGGGYAKASAGSIHDDITDLHGLGMHKIGDWLTEHAKANGYIANPDVKTEPGHENAFLASQLSYGDLPDKDAAPLIKAFKAKGDPAALAEIFKNDPYAVAAVSNQKNSLSMVSCEQMKAGLKAAGIDSEITPSTQTPGWGNINIKGGVHPDHVAQIKADMSGDHKAGTDEESVYHNGNYNQFLDPPGLLSHYEAALGQTANGKNPVLATKTADAIMSDGSMMTHLANGDMPSEDAQGFADLINAHPPSVMPLKATVVPSEMGGYKLHFKHEEGAAKPAVDPTSIPSLFGDSDAHLASVNPHTKDALQTLSEVFKPGNGMKIESAQVDGYESNPGIMAALAHGSVTKGGAQSVAEQLNEHSDNYVYTPMENDDGSYKLHISPKSGSEGLYADSDAHLTSDNEYHKKALETGGGQKSKINPEQTKVWEGVPGIMAGLAHGHGTKEQAKKVASEMNESSEHYTYKPKMNTDGTFALHIAHKQTAEDPEEQAAPEDSPAEPLTFSDHQGALPKMFVDELHKSASSAKKNLSSGKYKTAKIQAQNAMLHLDGQSHGQIYGHHITNAPMSPIKATNLANMINAGSSKYTAEVYKSKVKGVDGKSSTVHKIKLYDKSKMSLPDRQLPHGTLNPKPRNIPAHQAEASDKAYADKVNPSHVLDSSHPTGIKLAQKESLPEGVSVNDIALSQRDKQTSRVDALRAAGKDHAADFLASHFEGVNQHPEHDKSKYGQVLHVAGSSTAPAPFRTAQQITDAVVNGGRSLPQGITLGMLDATDPVKQNNLVDKCYSSTGRQWLRDFYNSRKEANEAVGADMKTSGMQKTAHGKFSDPSVYAHKLKSTEVVPHADQDHGEDGQHMPIKLSGTKADASHLSSQARIKAREGPLVGASGKAHDATHLALSGSVTNNAVAAQAGQKAKDIFSKMLTEHQARIASGHEPVDPFGSVPVHGVHPQSAHAYQLTQTHFEPMLHAARACIPSKEHIEEIMRGTSARSSMRLISSKIYDTMCSQMGISQTQTKLLNANTKSWLGSGQSEGAMRIRIATNLLRGIRPGTNTYFDKSAQVESGETEMLAAQTSPDYLKAMLANKAITQAFMERLAGEDHVVPLVRGISQGTATSMLGKSIHEALKQGDEGHKFQSTEMTVSGFSMTSNAAQNFGSTFLHRDCAPEHIWQSQACSPTHGSFAGEMEHFVQNDGGGAEYIVTSDELPSVRGNYVTTSTGMQSDRAAKFFSSGGKKEGLDTLAKSVVDPNSIPPMRDAWYGEVPSDWTPTPAQVVACRKLFTDPDGVMRIETDRDLGFLNEYSSEKTRADVREGRTS